MNEIRNPKSEIRKEFAARREGFSNSGFGFPALCLALLLLPLGARANSTNDTPPAPSAPATLDESAFRIISERNIFNANRSGGTVRSFSSRRPARVETFALVGTMGYEKGAFAFFEGTSSDFTKVLKPNGVIAGYKVVDILANGVRLEMDGHVTELAVGTGMRREDQGAWKFSETVAVGNNPDSNNDMNGRSYRGDRGDRGRRGEDAVAERNGSRNPEVTSSAGGGAVSSAAESEILKRLRERREKEEQ